MRLFSAPLFPSLLFLSRPAVSARGFTFAAASAASAAAAAAVAFACPTALLI